MRFTEEHGQLRRTVREFVEKEIVPHAETWEREGGFPGHVLFKKAGRLGLLGVNKPEAYGGMGLDYSYQMIVTEELGGSHCGGVSMAFGVQTDMATPALARWGTHELKQEFLVPAIAGDQICAIAVSEASGGSDVAAIKTTAKKDGGDYIINGSKMWITNAAQADWLCLLVNTGEGKPHANKTLVIVPTKLKGVTIGAKIDKLGMRSSDTCPVFFEDVRVPQRHRIGEEGMGFMMQMVQFQEERLCGAIGTLRSMDGVIDATIAYCKERQTFGAPLIDNQVIHFRMAELCTEVEALRSLIYRAVEDYVGGTDVTMLASMAKLKAGRLAREVADSCLQYWGGMGFTWENVAARAYRDSRLLSIGGGADEIMLAIICKLMGIAAEQEEEAAVTRCVRSLVVLAVLAAAVPAHADDAVRPDARELVGFRVRGDSKLTERTAGWLAHVAIGDPISPDELPEIEASLMSSELFESVKATLEEAPGGVVLVATVVDKLSWIAAPTLFILPQHWAVGAGYAEANLRGEDRKKLLYGQLGNRQSLILGTYLDPSVRGTRLQARVDVYLLHQIIDEYANPMNDPRSFAIDRESDGDVPRFRRPARLAVRVVVDRRQCACAAPTFTFAMRTPRTLRCHRSPSPRRRRLGLDAAEPLHARSPLSPSRCVVGTVRPDADPGERASRSSAHKQLRGREHPRVLQLALLGRARARAAVALQHRSPPPAARRDDARRRRRSARLRPLAISRRHARVVSRRVLGAGAQKVEAVRISRIGFRDSGLRGLLLPRSERHP